MAALGGASFLTYLFFRETFRVERSLAWQKARKAALERAASEIANAQEREGAQEEGNNESQAEKRWKGLKESKAVHGLAKGFSTLCLPFKAILAWCEGTTTRFAGVQVQEQERERKQREEQEKQETEKKRELEREQTTSSNDPTFVASGEQTPYASPSYHGPGLEALHTYTPGEQHVDGVASASARAEKSDPFSKIKSAPVGDLQRQRPAPAALTRQMTGRSITGPRGEEIKFKPTLADVSPLGSAGAVLKQPHNAVALFYSAVSAMYAPHYLPYRH